jgi:cytochrome c-type biogenesis protein CcmE
MKKSHILGIIVIALAIGVILSTISDSSTYAAFRIAATNPGSEYHVVGKLDKQKEMHYDPKENTDLFSFYIIDNTGEERKVLFNGTKPNDFERSEQIVVVGKIKGSDFIASSILMKCPSKYNNTKEELKEIKAKS